MRTWNKLSYLQQNKALSRFRMFVPIFVAVLAAIGAYFHLSPTLSTADPSVAQIEALRDYVSNDFAVSQPIHIRFRDIGFRFPDLIEATQVQLDYHLRSRGIPYRYPLIDELPKHIPRFGGESTVTKTADVFVLTEDGTEVITSSEPTADADSVDVSIAPSSEFSLDMAQGGNIGVWLDSYKYRAMMTYTLEAIHANDLPFYLAQTISDHLCEIDLNAYANRHTIDFDLYVPQLTLNVIAAEDSVKKDSSVVEDALKESIDKHLDAIRPFVNVTSKIQTIDVTKNRIPLQSMKNSTSQLTFIYSTTLEGFLNQIDGSHVYHLTRDVPKEISGDTYGTEYIEAQKLNENPRINITDFLSSAFNVLESQVGLTEKCSNKHLEVYFITKAHAINGISKTLDLISKSPDAANLLIFKEVCGLIDTILTEQEHDWATHLQHTLKLYNEAKERSLQ
ncbi:hypothetical protein FT663_01148 [Candidozyma haemuli var. vulneris]|nr:hypothetical protein FT662_00448 [[Candida] haemuloni var. vulneris]KAF3994792.1 hypothetical protein FT663_01148 [[Candida] haemuloni var. vulneris]